MTKAVLAAGALIMALAWAAPARAYTVVSSPYGTQPVSARIGSYTVFGVTGQVIVWQRKSDGACNVQVIGNAAGLSDDYLVNGTPGNDRLEIQPWWTSNSFCGRNIAPLVYGAHFIDLDGGAGDDIVVCGSKGDTFIYGSDGNDGLLSFNPNGVLSGGPGDDSIYADGNGSGEVVTGDAGNDCLFDFTGAAARFDGGDGTDTVSGTRPANATSVELTATNCPINFVP
jgi:Ca2+-binding RTX toxin-like protein